VYFRFTLISCRVFLGLETPWLGYSMRMSAPQVNYLCLNSPKKTPTLPRKKNEDKQNKTPRPPKDHGSEAG
jgi:hypothetical protein